MYISHIQHYLWRHPYIKCQHHVWRHINCQHHLWRKHSDTVKKTQQIRHSSIYACVKTLNPCCHGYDSMVSKPKLLYEEVNCKTASDILPVSHFLFSIKSMNRFDFIICWFSLYIIAEKSIKIFFYEIELGNKVDPHYHIAPMLTLLHISFCVCLIKID